ncbi:GIY-YIG nuclease family protein [Eilatimonas milleporae]|uniref:Uri superfamily endonuclease n=1 Tax=Eilatimonas milleporae TaxID=911205 RepID=A0A3M0BV15_9PROT|nr:GIY-YIG nuclease family protein [Eilatimonas milleporae]RMB01411.1 Uri superfamily endonuclease [Eilatimonas milleporae]
MDKNAATISEDLDQAHSALTAAGVAGTWVGADDVEALGNRKGAYILALRLAAIARVAVPGRDTISFKPAWYFYAGSARGSGGIRARLKRHFRHRKKIHWHIDRLTVNASLMAGFAVTNGRECDLVGHLLASQRFTIAAKGFGNTDCTVCHSHLLRRM